jgi:hypothetical protein
MGGDLVGEGTSTIYPMLGEECLILNLTIIESSTSGQSSTIFERNHLGTNIFGTPNTAALAEVDEFLL